ncbi:hypothetical protein C2G38_2182900 [Gigaspora rosea]|uniref:Uncharacterized protein n=1 Tax=Gigaspora rosea TaxID=44941 RepID=A0A397V936_9GLOM|nr:hypothetical protein C2G38_2182900 [Gigaspora rosea]
MSNAFGCSYVNSITVARNNAGVNDKNITSVEVGIESQALLYEQKPMEAEKSNHVSEKPEPSFELKARIKEGSLMDLQKTTRINDINKTESGEFNKKKKLKTVNVPLSLEEVMDDKPELVLDEEGLDRHTCFGKDERLNEACELWIKKVDQLREMNIWDKKNELEEKKSRRYNNFKKFLHNLDKISEIEPPIELNVNPIEDEYSKTKNLEDLKDNHQETLEKSAEESLSVESGTADMGILTECTALDIAIKIDLA